MGEVNLSKEIELVPYNDDNVIRYLMWIQNKPLHLKNVKNRTSQIQCRNWEHRKKKISCCSQYFPNKCTSKYYVIAITE